MSLRDPLIEGEGEFHSYVEDTEVDTGYSVAHLDLFLSRVRCDTTKPIPIYLSYIRRCTIIMWGKDFYVYY